MSSFCLDPSNVQKQIDNIKQVLTPDLLNQKYKNDIDLNNPTLGHCAIAAEALYFLLGGPLNGLIAWVARDVDDSTHWWLQHKITKQRYDPTAEQFYLLSDVPPYMRGILGRPAGFMGLRKDSSNVYGFYRKPSIRASKVLDRVKKLNY